MITLKYLSIIVGFIFIVFAASVSVVNTEAVALFIPFTSVSLIMPLYVVILFTAVFSFLLGGLFMFFHSFMLSLRKRKAFKEKAQKE